MTAVADHRVLDPVETDEQVVAERGPGTVRRESAWLFAGFALTAAIGFGFWIVAARTVPAATLGTDAALISLITATAAVASSGLGSALVVMLGRETSARLLIRAYLAAVVVAGVLGAGAGVLAAVFVVPDANAAIVVPVVAFCCVGWAFITLQGQALVGYERASYTVFINGPVNVAKLLIISLVAGFSLAVPHAVLIATMAPALISVVIVAAFVLPRAARSHAQSRATASVGAVEGGHVSFTAYVLRDTAAIGSTLGVGLSLAFLVTVLVGPVAGALFSIAYQFSIVLDLVAVSVALALARGASVHSALRSEALGVWRKVVILVAIAAVGTTIAAPVVFMIMGPEYDEATGALVVALLALACVARASFELWAAVLRARREVGRVALWSVTGAVTTLAAVFLLTPLWGVVGTASAVLVIALGLGAVGLVGLVREARTVA